MKTKHAKVEGRLTDEVLLLLALPWVVRLIAAFSGSGGRRALEEKIKIQTPPT